MSDPHIPTDRIDTSTSNGPGLGKGRCFNWMVPWDTRVADRFNWLKIHLFRSYLSQSTLWVNATCMQLDYTNLNLVCLAYVAMVFCCVRNPKVVYWCI